MENRTLNYAKKQLDLIVKDNDLQTVLLNGKIYIELKSNRCLQLSETEVMQLAVDYLKSEIDFVENDF